MTPVNNSHIKPDRLESLLESYYNGTSTQADQRCLSLYFTSTPIQDIPKRYRADAIIFRAAADTSTTEAPDSLEKAIIDNTCGGHHNRTHIRRNLWWLSRAAAAAVALIIGIFMYRSADNSLAPAASDPSVVVAANVADECLSTYNEYTNEPTDTATTPTRTRPTLQSASPTVQHETAAVANVSEPADGYFEVIDSARAAEITIRALEQLSNSFKILASQTDKADEAISCIKQNLQTITL